jgi:hypothetical protein|tara:strand:+ start:717 stop:911 length:195 start_codon:yes stop_codon:yes gene_type:complete
MLIDEAHREDDAFIASIPDRPAHIADGRGFDTENIPQFGWIEVDEVALAQAEGYNNTVREYIDE